MRVLALDFDGVISDSAPEAFVIALRSYVALRPGSALARDAAALDPEGAPRVESVRAARLYAPFVADMPLGNRAEDYAVVLAALEHARPLPDQSAYDALRGAQPEDWLRAFHVRFYQERAALAARDLEGWAGLMAPYATLLDVLRRRAGEARLAIATAKDRDSVRALLARYGVSTISRRPPPALTRRRARSKRAPRGVARTLRSALRSDHLRGRQGQPSDHVAALGVRALAAWGYNGLRERQPRRGGGAPRLRAPATSRKSSTVRGRAADPALAASLSRPTLAKVSSAEADARMDLGFRMHAERTPNPNSIKWVLGRAVVEGGVSAHFDHAPASDVSPLGARLFAIDGVVGAFFASNFTTALGAPVPSGPTSRSRSWTPSRAAWRGACPSARPSRSASASAKATSRHPAHPRAGDPAGRGHGRRRHRVRRLPRWPRRGISGQQRLSQLDGDAEDGYRSATPEEIPEVQSRRALATPGKDAQPPRAGASQDQRTMRKSSGRGRVALPRLMRRFRRRGELATLSGSAACA
jgi:phosphoglycolate phosphatase-like HAD superfamily hydrolase